MVDHRTPTERLSRKRRHYREHARKIYHTSREEAERHAAVSTALRPLEAPRRAYECRWAEDWTLGERAMVHWHVGRTPHVEGLADERMASRAT